MANLSKDVVVDILGDRKDISTLIETGTADARSTLIFAELFPTVHTIELSEELYGLAATAIATNPPENGQIIQHQGDSAEVLPKIINDINEPIFFYLDAHYCEGYEGMAADSEMPVFKELDAIARRKFNDIIVIDDFHAFLGNHPISRKQDWENVHPVALKERFEIGDIAEAYSFNDQYIIKMHNRI